MKSISPNKNQCQFEISIIRKEKPVLFCASSEKDVKRWVDSLKRLIEKCKLTPSTGVSKGGETNLGHGIYNNEIWKYGEEPEEFPVLVEETESAVGCNIAGQQMIIQIYSHCFCLRDSKVADVKYVWPYKFIRRYGFNKKSFTFETGRNSVTGQGVFVLITKQARTIFNKIHGSAQEKSSQPDVPPRGYKDTKTNGEMHTSAAAPLIALKPKTKSVTTKPKLKPKPKAMVPVAENYSEPATLQYANLTEKAEHQSPSASKNQSSNQYSEPEVSSPNSMADIAAKIRCQQEDVNNECEYDVVNLSGLEVSSNQAEDKCYGQLYAISNQIKKA